MIRKAVALALEGNTTALRLCLERLLPPRRECPKPIALPQTRNAGDLASAMAATAGAEILAREGTGLARLVDVFLKALDMHDFARRLPQLEKIGASGSRGSNPSAPSGYSASAGSRGW